MDKVDHDFKKEQNFEQKLCDCDKEFYEEKSNLRKLMSKKKMKRVAFAIKKLSYRLARLNICAEDVNNYFPQTYFIACKK